MRAVLLVLALAACAGPPTSNPAASDAAPLERSLSVTPGAFVEANLRLPADSRATAEFEADGALTWNTHSHPGGELVVHSEGAGASGTLAITAAAAGIYSMLWENRTEAAITLRVTVLLPAGASVHSWHPE